MVDAVYSRSVADKVATQLGKKEPTEYCCPRIWVVCKYALSSPNHICRSHDSNKDCWNFRGPLVYVLPTIHYLGLQFGRLWNSNHAIGILVAKACIMSTMPTHQRMNELITRRQHVHAACTSSALMHVGYPWCSLLPRQT